MEAGWTAFDYLLDRPLTIEDIEKIGALNLGSFIFMRQLKQPFFKVENHHYIIKGVAGNDFFRIAIHRDDVENVLPNIERKIQLTMDNGG